ncbi:MAG TPA: sugar ABC transporter substrate-binding protein, partial [Chloroflexota bacterium]|nr:sugar ABC transporter substrate-binding protein [Chloroflexota bacterium]
STASPMAACAVPGTGGPETPKESASSAPARVTVMFPGGGSEEEDFKPVFEAMAQKFPKITAEWTPGGTGGYNAQYTDKVGSLLAAGDAPDVFKSLVFTFGQFAHSGAYYPLDDLIKRHAAEVKLDDFFPAHVEAGKYKGKKYSLPHDGAPQALWVNVDLHQREGLALPSWDTTWADLLKNATALTKREGTAKASQLGMGRPEWLTWVWSAGGDLYSADGTRLLLDQPPAIEAFTWLQDAVHKHRVMPAPDEQSDPTLSNFVNGRIAAVTGVRGALGNFRNIDGFTYDAAPVPKGAKGRVARLGVGYTSIWSGSKAKEASFTVLNFICSAEGQRLKISRGFAHPSRKSAVEEAWFKDYRTPRSASNRINTIFPDTIKRGEARAVPAHPREADINRVIESNLGALWNGSKSAREVAQNIVTESASLMKG